MTAVGAFSAATWANATTTPKAVTGNRRHAAARRGDEKRAGRLMVGLCSTHTWRKAAPARLILRTGELESTEIEQDRALVPGGTELRKRDRNQFEKLDPPHQVVLRVAQQDLAVQPRIHRALSDHVYPGVQKGHGRARAPRRHVDFQIIEDRRTRLVLPTPDLDERKACAHAADAGRRVERRPVDGDREVVLAECRRIDHAAQ